MAGTDSDLPKGNKKLSEFEELFFTFDCEKSHSSLSDRSNHSSAKFKTVISGDFEFVKRNRYAYWRSFVPVIILFAMISAGVYGSGFFDMKNVSASIVKAYDTKKEKQESKALNNNIIQIDSTIDEKLVDEELMVDSSLIKKVKEDFFEIEKSENKEAIVFEEVDTLETNKIAEVKEPIPISPAEKIPEIEPIKTKSFKTKSFEEARLMSKNTGRYIFVKFGADWCTPCQLMETTAMKDEMVLKLLNEKYIVLNVDVDENRGFKIKEKFYVEQLPTLIILDDLGNQMERRESALGTTGLIKMLESMLPYIYLEEEMLTVSADFVKGTSDR